MLSLFWKRILSYFPSNLPVGKTEFDVFAADVIELSGKYADEDSMRYALASMVIHAGPSKNSPYQTQPGRIPKNHFVNGLRKAAANQVASGVFQDIKEKQKAAQEAQTVEATTINAEVVASDGQKN